MHPLVRTGRRYVIIGLSMVALVGALMLVTGFSIALSVVGLMGAVLFIWNGRALMTSGMAIPLIQESLAAITKGRLDEAERVTTALPAKLARRPMVARAITVQRALIALMRGDAARAESHATESIAVPSGMFTRDWDNVYMTEARAIRALAFAAQGEAAKALADADAIEASSHALSSSLARASLARAIVHAHGGDKTALGAHLTAHGSLILEHVLPRERSLTRALRAMARASGKSVYREAARPSDESTAEGGVRDWIGKVAPDAAGHAPREVYVAAPDVAAPQADPVAMRTIANARAAAVTKKRSVGRVLALWAVLIVMFLSIWQFLTPAERTVVPVPEPEVTATTDTTFTFVILFAFIVFFAAFISWTVGRARKHQRRLFAADRDLALGRTDAGRKGLIALAASPYPGVSSTSRLRLAALANAEGRFAEAVTDADIGIGLCNQGPTAKALTSDMVAPSLIAERALALAATDRFAEAETELAHLASGFPTFALMERAIFRVRLVTAVRRSDLASAARIALSRTPEMPLDLKIDLLADAALAVSGEPMSTEERERITTELRAMPEASAWITQVAGDLSRLRVATPPPSEDELEEEAPETAAARHAQL